MLTALTDEREGARRARYREYLDVYEGRQWLGSPLPRERRLTANYARALVRKTASYLFPESVTFTVLPEGTPAAARAEDALAAVYAANDLAAVDFAAAIDAAVLGDGAFKVVWDEAERRPVVTAVDVQGLAAWWQADDPRRVTRVVQRTSVPAEEARARYGVRADGGPVAVVEDWRPERFTLTVGGVTRRDGPNPFGWLPYVIFANAPRPQEFWGESDLADLLDVQRELNRRLSVVAGILELSGNPIAVLENVEAADGIQVGPGALWELPEGARAYLLDLLGGGGVGLHMQYIDLLYRVLHDLAETPRTAFGDSGRELSGAALEVEIQPLVQKVKRKRRAWDSVFARRNALILDLLERFGGLDLGGARRTRTVWPPILPADWDATVRNEVQLVANGLRARRTALAHLGVDDPERELALIESGSRAVGQSGSGVE
ncbi:MAG: phage portal protein [Thermomicrobiales bacterium]